MSLRNATPGPAAARRSFPARPRRGAVLVEGAVVLGVFLVLLLGMLELALLVLRQNVLADAARRVARETAVHGRLAPPERDAWGPEPFTGTAADASPIARTAERGLITVDPRDVNVRVEWLEASNDPGQRIRVRIRYRHRPLYEFVPGTGPIALTATSTREIAH